MVAEHAIQEPMSVEEWRQLERTSEVRHEYIDGYVRAMAGGTLANTRIAMNAMITLSDLLRGRSTCEVYAVDAATRLSSNRYTYPDVVVTCAGTGIASRTATEIAQPCVVIEVLSESTEHYDRTEKFEYYRACDSLQEYVLVNTDRRLVEVYRRDAEGRWGLFSMHGPADSVRLAALDALFPVAVLYERTDVPEVLPARSPRPGQGAREIE